MLNQFAPHLDDSLLSVLLALPCLGILALAFLPRGSHRAIHGFTAGLMLVEFLLSLRLLAADYTTGGYQHVTSHTLMPRFGIGYTLGVDGISLWLVLLTTFMTPLALLGSWSSIESKRREFAICFLFLETAMIGAFVALDVFLFYVFWELVLVPAYLIIGIWGGAERIKASVKFFLYTLAGSLLMFVAIVYLASAYNSVAGVYTFDIRELSALVLDADTQLVLFLAFALAFAIKIPLVPFHTWVPLAYGEAPTGGTVMLTAVLLKMGTYGFIRFAMPLFPLATHRAAPTLSVLAIVGILFGAYCAWVQKDVKKLIAYSSISHLGFVMLGIFSVTPAGVGGAVLQMVNHGISTGALFLLVGVITERRQTRDLSDLGGLAKVMPLYAAVFVLVALSSIGVPGLNGFVGEFLILNGTFLSRSLPTPFFFALFAALGLIFSAVYMLRAVLKMFWGPVTNPDNEDLTDLGRSELLSLAPLVAMVIVLGLAPSLVQGKVTASVSTFLRGYDRKLLDSAQGGSAHLLKPLPAGIALKEGEER
ncbi:MAG: NADH-quinone oxidoreductase subunit M [Polyangiales bacterium]